MICDDLELKSISLMKLKHVCEFDDKVSSQQITHVIYSKLLMKKHRESTVSMLITVRE